MNYCVIGQEIHCGHGFTAEMNTMDHFEDPLVEVVQKYENQYYTSSKSYRDTLMSDKHWKGIAPTLSIDENVKKDGDIFATNLQGLNAVWRKRRAVTSVGRGRQWSMK